MGYLQVTRQDNEEYTVSRNPRLIHVDTYTSASTVPIVFSTAIYALKYRVEIRFHIPVTVVGKRILTTT